LTAATPITVAIRTLSLTAGVLICALGAAARQSNCGVKLDQLAQAPELFGFHLGMTFDQVTARVPQARFPPNDELGIARTTINPGFDPSFDKPSFAGVRTVSMDFLDGKLISLWIGYDESFKWQKLDEFVAGLSKSLNLSVAWPVKGAGRELVCEGVSVFASMIGGSPALRLIDQQAQAAIATRRQEVFAAKEAAEAAAAAVVIGDTRTKLFYPNDCDELDKVPEANRVSFKDKDEAEKAGYKRSRDCP